jgi:V/A-type H+-transporting ATPase subunit K
MESKLRLTITLTAVAVLGIGMMLGLGLNAALAATPEKGTKEGTAGAPAVKREPLETVGFALSVAITTSIGCLSAGIAVGKVGSAALGAASERPELLGRALIFVGLAEGIAIYGLIIAILLMGKL